MQRVLLIRRHGNYNEIGQNGHKNCTNEIIAKDKRLAPKSANRGKEKLLNGKFQIFGISTVQDCDFSYFISK